MDQTHASASAPSGALRRALVRSVLLAAAAGAFLVLSTASSSAADGEPTITTATQSGTSTESGPRPEPEPAQDEEPQPAPAEEPDQGGSTTPSPGSSGGSDGAETPVQTEDSDSTAVRDRLTRTSSRRAGAAGVVDGAADGAAATLERSSAHTTDLLEDGTVPDRGDIDTMTDPLRSVVERRLAADHLVPDLGAVPARSDAASPGHEPTAERRVRRAPADQPPPADAVRRGALPVAGAGGLVPTTQVDWTSDVDARTGDADAAAHREGPASPNPMPFRGDVLTASSSVTAGFDLASAARPPGDVEARAGADAPDSRAEGVHRADPADHPGFSPD